MSYLTMIFNRPDDDYEEVRRRYIDWPLLVKAIIKADQCSEAREGVGLLYWMEQCFEDDSEEYAKIKEVLSLADDL